jgi:hypothetical protein
MVSYSGESGNTEANTGGFAAPSYTSATAPATADAYGIDEASYTSVFAQANSLSPDGRRRILEFLRGQCACFIAYDVCLTVLFAHHTTQGTLRSPTTRTCS